MIGPMLAGVELALRALDRGAEFLRDPRFVLGAVVVSLAAAVKLPALLALGFVGMAAARARGGRVRDVAVVAAVLSAVAGAVLVLLGVGQRAGLRLDGHAGHRERDPQLDVAGHGPGPAVGPDRHPRRARRPHRHRADDHPRARRPGRRAAVSAAAAARAARAARPGHRAGGRARRGRAARTGGAPLVPAVGGDPAGRHPRDAATPARRAGGVGAARSDAAAHRCRLRVPRRSSCPWRSWPGSSSCSPRCSSCGASCVHRPGGERATVSSVAVRRSRPRSGATSTMPARPDRRRGRRPDACPWIDAAAERGEVTVTLDFPP